MKGQASLKYSWVVCILTSFFVGACGGSAGIDLVDEGEPDGEPQQAVLVPAPEPEPEPEPESPVTLDPDLPPEVVEEPEPEPPYVEPSCPEQPPVESNYQCEPFAATSGCRPGFGCVPYLVYPDSDPCSQSSYGSFCAPSGDAEQGEPCGEVGQQCAAGFLCVVGALAGRSCGQLCVPGENDQCRAGLICGETDVPGVGVCF